MILDVPLFRQRKNSLDCGLAGISMILNYYRFPKSITELKKHIVTDKVGSYAPQLGIYLQKNGFKVEIITMHPSMFTKEDKMSSNKRILNRFKKLLKEYKSNQHKKVLNYFIKYLESGGKIQVKVPDIKDIKSEIEQRRPIGASLTSNFLKERRPKFDFHFNLITGFDKKYIYVNDPLWDKRGGKHKYLINDFFFGLYASAYGDLDNACLIKVKK